VQPLKEQLTWLISASPLKCDVLV